MTPIVRAASRIPGLIAVLNRFIINRFAFSTVPRPHRFSLWSPSKPTSPAPVLIPATKTRSAPKSAPPSVSDYTSWPSLVDRRFTGRHLPPSEQADDRPPPPAEEVVDLFRRTGEMTPNPRSSALFCFFAQWFTDSFLRTHPDDPRRSTSNHEIDLCQIYGLDEPSTWALRSQEGGRLKSRSVKGWEYPEFIYANGEIDRQFYDPAKDSERGLSYLRAGRAGAWADALNKNVEGATTDPARRDWLYAAGLDRGNSTIVYTAFSTIFLREHNRIAGILEKANPGWDNDRLFETARLINIRQLLSVVVDDYIRHIGGVFPFALDRTFAERKRWYRTNRITMEFNLLYRWHPLVPDRFALAGRELANEDYRFNNALLEEHGVEQVIADASAQPAGRIGLFNTPYFLLDKAEPNALKWARDFRLRPFNEYRIRFGLKPYHRIDDFADGPEVARELKRLYRDDMYAVEFTVGLFAEKRGASDVMPETLRTMVAYDAFTHILTNPVLSKEIHCPATFSEAGWDIVEKGATLADIVGRNTDPRKNARTSLSYR